MKTLFFVIIYLINFIPALSNIAKAGNIYTPTQHTHQTPVFYFKAHQVPHIFTQLLSIDSTFEQQDEEVGLKKKNVAPSDFDNSTSIRFLIASKETVKSTLIKKCSVEHPKTLYLINCIWRI